MPKKTKNRSNKQKRYARQSRARQARLEALADEMLAAAQAEFPGALAAGAFTVLTEEGALKVSVEEMQQRVNGDLIGDGEPPLDGLDELKRMLNDDVIEGHISVMPNGLWIFPNMYLPEERA
jgi:hypothetical protein